MQRADNKKQVAKLIELLKMEKYQPKPVRRTYIPKKSGEMRPLGIPTFTDKLVQEVVRQLLEAIYEPIFCKTSHGFRPNRSCHTALYQVKSTCRGTNWVIEGDITACFENVDHEILIGVLSRKIQDGRLLELIRRFLKAGYFEFKEKHNSLSGTPQGGIISPRKNGKPYPFIARNNYPVMDIISMYNAEIRGLYNYYCLATDVGSKLATFKYYRWGHLSAG